MSPELRGIEIRLYSFMKLLFRPDTCFINSLQNDKILDWSKLVHNYADDNNNNNKQKKKKKKKKLKS